PFGEPVRVAEVIWTLMNEPGIADVRNLHLVRFPADAATVITATAPAGDGAQVLTAGDNAVLASNQIPAYVDRDTPPPFNIVYAARGAPMRLRRTRLRGRAQPARAAGGALPRHDPPGRGARGRHRRGHRGLDHPASAAGRGAGGGSGRGDPDRDGHG